MADTRVSSFPQGWGNRLVSFVQHAGPASYAQVTTGPVAGGDVVSAQAFGLKRLTAVFSSGITDDGLYRVEAISTTGDPTSVTLRWTVVSTGSQVAGAVNLSASKVKLFAIGY